MNDSAKPAGRKARVFHQLAQVAHLQLVLKFGESREYHDNVAALTLIPRAPGWLLGMFSSEGVPTPVVDVGRWAQVSGDAKPRKGVHVVRLGDGPQAWGLRVDGLPAVFDLSTAQPSEVSPQTLAGEKLAAHVDAVWALPNGSAALQLNWGRLLASMRMELAEAKASMA